MGKTLVELADIARAAWMECDLTGDHWAATAKAVRSKVIEEAIEALSGEIKSCTLGWDLVDKISEADAVKLLDTQRKIDIQALTALKDKADDDPLPE